MDLTKTRDELLEWATFIVRLTEWNWQITDCLWQGRNEDLERELNKLNEKDVKLEEDKNKIAEQYKQEYMQLKTDRDATIAQLQGFYALLALVKEILLYLPVSICLFVH